jgi:hypothetical protein
LLKKVLKVSESTIWEKNQKEKEKKKNKLVEAKFSPLIFLERVIEKRNEAMDRICITFFGINTSSGAGMAS